MADLTSCWSGTTVKSKPGSVVRAVAGRNGRAAGESDTRFGNPHHHRLVDLSRPFLLPSAPMKTDCSVLGGRDVQI